MGTVEVLPKCPGAVSVAHPEADSGRNPPRTGQIIVNTDTRPAGRRGGRATQLRRSRRRSGKPDWRAHRKPQGRWDAQHSWQEGV